MRSSILDVDARGLPDARAREGPSRRRRCATGMRCERAAARRPRSSRSTSASSSRVRSRSRRCSRGRGSACSRTRRSAGPDLPMLQGLFLVFSAAVILFNLVADLLYAVPRPAGAVPVTCQLASTSARSRSPGSGGGAALAAGVGATTGATARDGRARGLSSSSSSIGAPRAGDRGPGRTSSVVNTDRQPTLGAARPSSRRSARTTSGGRVWDAVRLRLAGQPARRHRGDARSRS